jgi:hypothetical protein
MAGKLQYQHVTAVALESLMPHGCAVRILQYMASQTPLTLKVCPPQATARTWALTVFSLAKYTRRSRHRST